MPSYDFDHLDAVTRLIADLGLAVSDNGGTVTLALCADTDGCTVTVTDHGPGMDTATRAHIFDQFYQGDTSHKTEGNSLGLAMVKKLSHCIAAISR